jgi:hypothetical protein
MRTFEKLENFFSCLQLSKKSFLKRFEHSFNLYFIFSELLKN